MSRYSKYLNPQNTPPTEPLLGKNMVKNNAGGFVFEVDAKTQLERFLILGTEGGTFYVKEQKLTLDNAKSIINMIKTNGSLVLKTLVDVTSNRRAPKMDPALFVLALACTYGEEEVKTRAYSLISTICKTSTHLFTFVGNIQDLRGWSRGLRSGVSKFYTSKSENQLAYQITKYRQRNGFTHKDVLRLSHPVATSVSQNNIFGYIVGKTEAQHTNNDLIVAVEKSLASKSVKEVVGLIKEYSLSWEMIPTEMMNQKEILKALLPNMQVMAIIRNLNRMTNVGLFESNLSDETKYVVSVLTNKELIKDSGVHPIFILNATKIYSRGFGDKGSLRWTANSKIVSAMEDAFENSFTNVEASGKNVLVAVDVSGSMTSPINNFALTCKETAAALSLSILKSEPNVDLIWFDTQVYKPKTNKNSSYSEVLKNTPHGGGTDCSLAFSYALSTGQKYDTIIILTDNETWAGKSHGQVHLDKYRKSFNKDVKVINIGMSANSYSVTENDRNLLHIAGFDSSIPELVSSFIKN